MDRDSDCYAGCAIRMLTWLQGHNVMMWSTPRCDWTQIWPELRGALGPAAGVWRDVRFGNVLIVMPRVVAP